MNAKLGEKFCRQELTEFRMLLRDILEVDELLLSRLEPAALICKRGNLSTRKSQFIRQGASHDSSLRETRLRRYQKKTHTSTTNLIDKLREVQKEVAAFNDLISIRSAAQRQIETIDQFQKAGAYKLVKWRLESCILLIEAKLNRKMLSKKTIIAYVKQLRDLTDLTTTIVARCLVNLLHSLLAANNQHLIYLQLQLIRLRNNHAQTYSRALQLQIQKAIQKCKVWTHQNIIMTPYPSATQTPKLKASPKCSQIFLRQMDILAKTPRTYRRLNGEASLHSVNQQKKQESQVREAAFMQVNKSKKQIIKRRVRLEDQDVQRESGELAKTTRTHLLKFASRANLDWRNHSIYRAINDSVSKNVTITARGLREQIECMPSFEVERCIITHSQILNNCHEVSVVLEKNSLMANHIEDLAFSKLSIEFSKTFRDEVVVFKLHQCNSNGNYLYSCEVTTNQCRSTRISFPSKQHALTFEELMETIFHVHIYFEAIQENVERQFSDGDVEVMFKFIRENQGLQLSERQIIRLLCAKEIYTSYYLHYFTIGSQITGRTVTRRIVNDIKDDMDFAISLKQLQNDYRKCMQKFSDCQNETSLNQCFEYLSHGRQEFCKQIYKSNGHFTFQVLLINKSVYRSFRLRKSSSGFTEGTGERREYSIVTWKMRRMDKFDLRLFIPSDQDYVIFLLRNVIDKHVIKKYRLMGLESIFPSLHQQSELQEKTELTAYKVSQAEEDVNYKEIAVDRFICKQMAHLLSMLMRHYEVYEEPNCYKLIRKIRSIVKMEQRFYECVQCRFQSCLRMFKIRKPGSLLQYLFLTRFKGQVYPFLTFIDTPYVKRVALKTDLHLEANLALKHQRQKHIIEEYTVILRKVLRIERQFIFVAVSFSQVLFCWRVDFYQPSNQACSFTYITPTQIPFDHSPAILQQRWQDCLRTMKLSRDGVTFGAHRYRLLYSFGSLTGINQKVMGRLELCQEQGELKYLLVDYREGDLCWGKSEENPFMSSINIFSDGTHKPQKNKIYQDLLIRLYRQFIDKKLTALAISVSNLEVIV